MDCRGIPKISYTPGQARARASPTEIHPPSPDKDAASAARYRGVDPSRSWSNNGHLLGSCGRAWETTQVRASCRRRARCPAARIQFVEAVAEGRPRRPCSAAAGHAGRPHLGQYPPSPRHFGTMRPPDRSQPPPREEQAGTQRRRDGVVVCRAVGKRDLPARGVPASGRIDEVLDRGLRRTDFDERRLAGRSRLDPSSMVEAIRPPTGVAPEHGMTRLDVHREGDRDRRCGAVAR